MVIEMCPITPEMQELITERASVIGEDKGAGAGMVPLRDGGWQKVIAGETTIEEVIAIAAYHTA